jgi:hypothetical protein
MSGPEVLVSVNGNRPLFGDAGADTVPALGFLGPDAAEPGPPTLKLAGLYIFAAMFDRDTRGVTEQDGISGIANHVVRQAFRAVRRPHRTNLVKGGPTSENWRPTGIRQRYKCIEPPGQQGYSLKDPQAAFPNCVAETMLEGIVRSFSQEMNYSP